MPVHPTFDYLCVTLNCESTTTYYGCDFAKFQKLKYSVVTFSSFLQMCQRWHLLFLLGVMVFRRQLPEAKHLSIKTFWQILDRRTTLRQVSDNFQHATAVLLNLGWKMYWWKCFTFLEHNILTYWVGKPYCLNEHVLLQWGKELQWKCLSK